MPSTAPSTNRFSRQSGQAIVLIALTMIVLFGMLGLAIDGGRAYVDRRELQDSVDAAVLAGGDNYLLQSNLTSAGSRAAQWFALNERIANYTGGSGSPATCPSTFPAGSTCTDYTWAGWPGDFMFGYFVNTFNGTIFSGTATHQVPVTFMQVLGVNPINNYTAIAQAIVGANWQTPALLTLGQQGCNGNTGDSLKIQGSVSVTITGDVYSNGDLRDQNGAPVTVNGSVYGDCSALPSGWTVSGSVKVPGAPVLPDPGYTSPYENALYPSNSTTAPPGSAVELKPGIYPADPRFTGSACYFLDPGIYTWPAGYTNNGGLVSNELRPPMEPAAGNFNAAAPQQFWGQGVGCTGDFYATAVASTGGTHPLKPGGAWGIEVSATRVDNWPGPNGTGNYNRQSAPSMCRPLESGMNGSTHGFQVVIGNVPGAQGYDIYGNPSGCNGNQSQFGFLGYVANSQTELNTGSGCGNRNNLPGFPNSPPAAGAGNTATGGASYGGCNLGYTVSEVFDNNNADPQGLGYVGFNSNGNTTWASVPPQCVISPTNPPTPFLPTPQGCNPPDGEQAPLASGLANETAPRAVTPNGDRADENQCRPQGTTSNPCAGATVTPGAVQFYFPPNACISQQGNGSTYVFSGYQYDWIVLFAPGNTPPPNPPQPNSCSGNNLTGNSATTFVGTIYMPTGGITINGSNRAPVAGQVIVYNALIDGSAGVAINYNPNVAPAPPAARLIV